MHQIFRFRVKSLFAVALCLMLAGVVSAQGGFIAYGRSSPGRLAIRVPVVLYTFQGNAGIW
ncbi:MAG: hypothetical protein H6671_06390 [Anaerolineaceae bacterium]|nr:hypothetical protein [Anaerolineaceae bacterium]